MKKARRRSMRGRAPSARRAGGPPMRVLRSPEAVAHDPAVDPWLDQQPPELRALARRWFETMRACGRDVRKLMHDGAPTAYVRHAAFGYVNVYRHHMNTGLFNGAVLADPAGLLEGNGIHAPRETAARGPGSNT